MTDILKSSSQHDQRRFIYGRRHGPKAKPAHKRLLQDLLPKVRVELNQSADLHLDPFITKGPLWLEVGFGGGEHLVSIASSNPDCSILGVEPYVTGVAKLLAAVEDQSLNNVRIVVDDARVLLKQLPKACLERAYILYPDPWPKARHNKRRIVNDDTIADLTRLIQPGGELRIATDHDDYKRWILAVMRRASGFEWLAKRPGDWRQRPDDQIQTRYEAKAIRAGRVPVYLRYRRCI